MAPLILTVGTRPRWVLSRTPRPFYFPGKSRGRPRSRPVNRVVQSHNTRQHLLSRSGNSCLMETEVSPVLLRSLKCRRWILVLKASQSYESLSERKNLIVWRGWTPGLARNHQVGAAVHCHLLAIFCSECWQLKCLVCHYNGYILLGICSRCSLPALALCCFVSMKFNRCRSSGGSKAHSFEWRVPYDRVVSFIASTVAVSTWPTDRPTKQTNNQLAC